MSQSRARNSALSVEGGFDYAEMFPAVPDIEAGDIVMVDPSNTNGYGVKKSDKPYENTLLGVISSKPGFLTGDRKAEDAAPVALAGRVPVKVNLEGGAINPGDPITSSSVPGVGMKAAEAGRVIGIALEGTTGDKTTIMMFVNPSWYNGPAPVTGTVTGTPGLTIKENDIIDFKNATLTNVNSIIAANGSWAITADGYLTAKQVVTDKLITSETTIIQQTDAAAVAEGVILSGYDAVVIHNPLMRANSKVFVSFLGDPRGGWWIGERGDGDFTVHVAQPALTDLRFEYWIVGVDDRRPPEAEAASSPEPSPEEPATEEAPPTDSASGTDEVAVAP